MISIIIYICYALAIFWGGVVVLEMFSQMILKGKTFQEYNEYMGNKYK